MLQDFITFGLFMIFTIFSWIVSYSDFQDLMICYGCKKIEPVYDFVIVGGGTAGCVLARRLAENKTASILILEAGGRSNSLLSIPVVGPMLQQSNFDWKYTTTRQTGACLGYKQQKCKFPLGKILGGSHQLNNMIYTRGHPDDYDSWFKDLPGYSYEKDVEEYFKRAEYRSLNGTDVTYTETPLTLSPIKYFSIASSLIHMAFQKLGYRTTITESSLNFIGGFYRPLVTQRNGRRWTTADHLLEMNFPNVEILTKARAEKIVFKDNLEASGVKFNYVGENLFVKARRALIISAGTIGSAKLLMLSGIGPKDHLNKIGIKVLKDLPVGNNLQDHVTSGFDLMLVNKEIGIGLKDIFCPVAMYKYIFQSEGPWTVNGVDLIGFVNLEFMHCKNQIKNNLTMCMEKYSKLKPDVECMLLPVGLTADKGVYLRNLFGIPDYVWDNFYAKINDTALGLLSILLHPKSRGTVRLLNKNPNSKPLINPNYFSHPHDLKTLVAFSISQRKLFDKMNKGIARLNEEPYPGCEHYDFGTLCYWKCYWRRSATTAFHPVGTCKMGRTPDSVVDYDFHVYGTNKLFVVDGSVLPSEISGHTMGPVIMMAERAADFLKGFHSFDMGIKEN